MGVAASHCLVRALLLSRRAAHPSRPLPPLSASLGSTALAFFLYRAPFSLSLSPSVLLRSRAVSVLSARGTRTLSSSFFRLSPVRRRLSCVAPLFLFTGHRTLPLVLVSRPFPFIPCFALTRTQRTLLFAPLYRPFRLVLPLSRLARRLIPSCKSSSLLMTGPGPRRNENPLLRS